METFRVYPFSEKVAAKGISREILNAETKSLDWKGKNCPEFCNELLDCYFFKLTFGSDSLELCLWTVASKTILSQ